MQIKTKLNVALMSSLLALSSVAWAAQTTESTNVNVHVADGMGKVIIVKATDGIDQTIEETFKVDTTTDVDALVEEILTKHGIDPGKSRELHQITNRSNHHGKNVVWVQKNNDVDVNLDNGQATVIIKKDNNGEVDHHIDG